MKRRLISALLGTNRVGFTAGTALLGVGASVVAAKAASIGNWCLLLGGAVMMYVEDRLGDAERDARTLAKGSSASLTEIRVDVFTSRKPLLQTGLLLLAAALLVTWGTVRVVDGHSHSVAVVKDHKETSAQTR
jgi:hypothetical protein